MRCCAKSQLKHQHGLINHTAVWRECVHRYVGPAQQRYGEYFCGVLFNPTLQPPSEITKMLRRIVFSPFDFVTLAAADPTLDGVWDSDDPAPFLVVYQHSKSVWAGPSETHVS